MANDKAELIGFTLMFVLGAALIVVASSAMSDSDQISYQTNGGTLSNAPTTYDPGEELDLPDPVRDGWVFAGWYLDSGLTVEFNGDTTGMSGKLVLYAAWETDKTGLKLVLTKSGSYVSGFTRYTVSGEYSATYLCYNREMGQYYLYIEDETTYKPIIGSATKNSSSDYQWENDGDDDMVLYGHATISTINGDVYCEVYRSISGEEVQWIGVNDGILYQATYKTGSSLFSTTSADITYKLTSVEQVTVEPSLTITLTTDDGISVEGLKDLYVPGETVKLTAVLDKDVEFRGWFVDGVYGSSKETISFQLTRDITLQAKAKHYYSISYDLNDGTVEGTLPDTYATGDTLTLPTPTNGDLIFEGWYLDEDFDEQFTGDTSDLERDISLYAA